MEDLIKNKENEEFNIEEEEDNSSSFEEKYVLIDDLPDWQLIDEETTKNEKENIQNNVCTSSQILKLFRLSQFQIEYLLKSQQELVEKLEKIEKLAKRYKKENKIIKEQFYYGPIEKNNDKNEKNEEDKNKKKKNFEECKHWKRELFRCNECNKLFLHSNFLFEHIQRKHNNNLDNYINLNNLKPNSKAIKILGMENND
uniref:C2H2-type domain-containing protein n=1 Tax=Meloidogyne hapla TaxID=6305 RepID=A0A1I8BK27_MELHA